MKFILPILILFCNTALGQNKKIIKVKRNEVVINDCRYWEMTYPAKLIKLIPIGGPSIYDGPLDASFEINMQGNKKDTIYYNSLMGKYIETDQLEKNKIAVGKIYRYITQSIISGNCPDMMKTIQLKQFKSP
jgi:hypothetical protein